MTQRKQCQREEHLRDEAAEFAGLKSRAGARARAVWKHLSRRVRRRYEQRQVETVQGHDEEKAD